MYYCSASKKIQACMQHRGLRACTGQGMESAFAKEYLVMHAFVRCMQFFAARPTCMRILRTNDMACANTGMMQPHASCCACMMKPSLLVECMPILQDLKLVEQSGLPQCVTLCWLTISLPGIMLVTFYMTALGELVHKYKACPSS